MATKGELADHATLYEQCLIEVHNALANGDYFQGLALAVSALPHVDGMMQYFRKYENASFETVEAIEIILRCAPLLFHQQSLGSVAVLLADVRRIERNTMANLAEKLRAAQRLMGEAHRLWCHVERHPDCRQDDLRRILGGEQEKWRHMAEFWEVQGVLRRIPEANSYRLRFVTNMDDVCAAKCPSCGALGKARKAKLLESITCPRCKSTVFFHLLGTP